MYSEVVQRPHRFLGSDPEEGKVQGVSEGVENHVGISLHLKVLEEYFRSKPIHPPE
jgi:hypothetical protein